MMQALSLDARTTALVLIDLQHGIVNLPMDNVFPRMGYVRSTTDVIAALA